MESLNSRHTVGDILEEPLVIHRFGDSVARKKRVRELLNIVGLPERSCTMPQARVLPRKYSSTMNSGVLPAKSSGRIVVQAASETSSATSVR